MNAHSLRSGSFLIVAPVGRDGELIHTLLKTSGYSSECLKRIGDLTWSAFPDAAGLIVTDEALLGHGIEEMRALVRNQPLWSDLPIILLTNGRNEAYGSTMPTQLRLEMGNLFLLDRPVRMESLVSAAQVAYNARQKQIAMRDATAKQIQSDEALRNSEKLASAGRLAATLAHEVNNPLEALSNLLYLIENSSTLEDAKSMCGLASQELGRVSEIVRQTLKFHRASGNPDFNDVFELASSAVALFRSKLGEHHIRLDLSGGRTVAYCSAGEIRQAVVNLVGNAIDAMPEGGNLHVRVSTVRTKGVKYARLTVADTGSGIPQEIRTSVFNQFFTTKGSRGTGLGLWLTRDIVLRSRGRLRMKSRTGKPSGTVFAIYLPSRPHLDLVTSPSSEPQQDGRAAMGVA